MMTEMDSKVLCKWDVRVMSELNTDNSCTVVLDDMKSEVLGGTFGTADTGDVS